MNDELFLKIISNSPNPNLEQLKKIRLELQKYINKDYSFNSVMEIILKELKEQSEQILYNYKQIVSGLSSSVFVNGHYINIIGGNKKRGVQDKIDEQTLFDIASITKMYMGLLIMKLKEMGLIDTAKKINELTKTFSLPNYSVDDLIHMRGIIVTPIRLDRCENSKQALNILKKTYVEDENKSIYTYTDIGLIILTYILEEIMNMKYSEILDKYLLSPLGLSATYHPNFNVTGNGRKDNKPNDPKANILKHENGSAGLFINSNDLILLSKHLFDGKYLSLETLKQFCWNNESNSKGIFGCYTYHKQGLEKTYVPGLYSKDSFAFEGYTGSVVVFDLINKIHNNILVNTMFENTLEKHPLYNRALRSYQEVLSEASIKICALEKIFEEPQSFVKKIKI
ncbi:MAG: beta-lactamase family protein [Firmicutes bacterium]|nr:beta-lactamase family protein [Bacillota bacterium]